MQKNSSKLVALGTLAVVTASTLGTLATPAHSAGWIRRHRTASVAIAAAGAYLIYRHNHKKHHVYHHYYRHR